MQLLNEDNFRQEIDKNELNFVLFSADWCGPCKAMTPSLESLASNLNLNVYKVKADQSINLSSEFSVMGIPHLVVIKNGLVTDTMTGFKSEIALKAFLEKHI